MNKRLQDEVDRLLCAARECMQLSNYDLAAENIKAALRLIRDERGPADLWIADVFEELALVHAATGKHLKCASIRNRVRVIRQKHSA